MKMSNIKLPMPDFIHVTDNFGYDNIWYNVGKEPFEGSMRYVNSDLCKALVSALKDTVEELWQEQRAHVSREPFDHLYKYEFDLIAKFGEINE